MLTADYTAHTFKKITYLLTYLLTYLQEEKAAKEREQESGAVPEEKKDEEKPRPNPQLEQGNTLPAKMGEFPPEMFGLPIEDVDDYYFNKYVRTSHSLGVFIDLCFARLVNVSNIIILSSFYPRDAMLARVIAIATCPSVRPSVCHAPVLCQNEES